MIANRRQRAHGWICQGRGAKIGGSGKSFELCTGTGWCEEGVERREQFRRNVHEDILIIQYPPIHTIPPHNTFTDVCREDRPTWFDSNALKTVSDLLRYPTSSGLLDAASMDPVAAGLGRINTHTRAGLRRKFQAPVVMTRLQTRLENRMQVIQLGISHHIPTIHSTHWPKIPKTSGSMRLLRLETAYGRPRILATPHR